MSGEQTHAGAGDESGPNFYFRERASRTRALGRGRRKRQTRLLGAGRENRRQTHDKGGVMITRYPDDPQDA